MFGQQRRRLAGAGQSGERSGLVRQWRLAARRTNRPISFCHRRHARCPGLMRALVQGANQIKHGEATQLLLRRDCRRAIDGSEARATLDFDRDASARPFGLLQNRAGLFLGRAECRGHRSRQFGRRAKARAACRNFQARQLQYYHCRAVRAARQIFPKFLRLAKGEFVFILADDDFCFDHAIAALAGVIDADRQRTLRLSV